MSSAHAENRKKITLQDGCLQMASFYCLNQCQLWRREGTAQTSPKFSLCRCHGYASKIHHFTRVEVVVLRCWRNVFREHSRHHLPSPGVRFLPSILHGH